MTQSQAGKYAATCRKERIRAQSENRPYIKPERPDANQLESMEAIARNNKKSVRALSYRMNVISNQMDVLTDFVQELADDNPQYREYLKIADYLNGSIIEIASR